MADLPDNYRPNGNHPVADIFPMMSKGELENLADDIRENGLREAVWVFEDLVIDGRNRVAACIDAMVKPKYRLYEGRPEALVAFVVSLNLHRRHLNETQRGTVAAKIANLSNGQNKSTARPYGRAATISNADAAALLNVGERTVRRAKRVIESGVPEVVEAMEQGNLTAKVAEDLIRLEPEKQREAVKAGPAAVAVAVREVRRAPSDTEVAEGGGAIKELGVGIVRANEAINSLSRIPKNDALRKRGFQLVTDWLKSNK